MAHNIAHKQPTSSNVLKRRHRQTISYAEMPTNKIKATSRPRRMSLLPACTNTVMLSQTLARQTISQKTKDVTQLASILDLPTELLSHILVSSALCDWTYCLDYELFRAFHDAHALLRHFALSELVRLYPQILDDDSSSSTSSHSQTWALRLQELFKGDTSSTTWDIMRYDSFHPTQLFDNAVTRCPTSLYVKKIPLFADDVYFILSVNNAFPDLPSRSGSSSQLAQKSWSRLREIYLDCQIADTVASHILFCSRRTLEVASFNLKSPACSRTPIRQSFYDINAPNSPISATFCMDALHSLTIDTSASLTDLFHGMSLPCLQTLELTSYPKPGFFRTSRRMNGDQHSNPILNSALNIPWGSIMHLCLRNYEPVDSNLDDIVGQCTQAQHVEVTGVRKTTYTSPSFAKSVKSL